MTDHTTAYRNTLATLTGPGAPFEIETRDGLRRYRNAPSTLAEAIAPARQHGDAEFLYYQGERWSFRRLLEEADAVSAGLAAAGIGPGARVAIAMRNFPEWMAAFIGTVGSGAIVVPVNSWGTPEDVAFALQDSGAELVFCDQRRYEGIAATAAELGERAVIARPDAPDDERAWLRWIAPHRGAGAPAVPLAADAPAMIMYTSGTSGRPKGALSTHDAICQALFNIECCAAATAMSNQELFAKLFGRGFPPTSLLAYPLFHVSGCHSQFLISLRGGRRLVMMYKWDADEAVDLVEQERITTIAATPPMLLDMLESPRFSARDTSSLVILGVGGAATPPLLGRLIHDKMPLNSFGTGWGMTETNAQGVSIAGGLTEEKPGSSGPVHPIIDLKVCDEQGQELPVGETGELWVRGVTVIREYWNRPDANASEFRDGWFRTGDVGRLDNEGFLYLADRVKDVIIRGGENIYPAEIEHILLEHEAVQEVAVVGLPDERMGEKVAAVIHLRPGAVLDEEEVAEYATRRLAAYKVPKVIRFSADPLPRNVFNKLLKRQIREELAAQVD